MTKAIVSKIRYSSEYLTCPVGNHHHMLRVWLSFLFAEGKYLSRIIEINEFFFKEIIVNIYHKHQCDEFLSKK